MILLDTAPLVALCDPRDALHAVAQRDLRRLGRQTLTTCTPVVTEAIAMLPHRDQRGRLQRFLHEFSVVPYATDNELALWSEVSAWLAGGAWTARGT